ncbi:MAG: FlgD immunoglobulin-like domain containing protein [Ignavibacteria bacterium]|nr:FlgD immunoglobulin-like domain containing protein [Ignavibacteria bacterium]
MNLWFPYSKFDKTKLVALLIAGIAASIMNTFASGNIDEGSENKPHKTQSAATITINCFTLDNNSPVINFIAKLKNQSNQIIAIDSSHNTNRVQFTNIPTPVEAEELLPTKLYLEQNYPNPFNPSTIINFGVAKEGTVSLNIFDITGKLVKTIVEQDLTAGNYSAEWMGENNSGLPTASGVYISALKQENNIIAKKIINLGSAMGRSSFKTNGNYSLETANSSNLNKERSVNYTIEISGTDATRPLIDTKTIALTLQGDTAFAVYLDRFLKPATLNNINNVSMNEDEQPTNPKLVDIWQNGVAGYDSLGNEVPDSLLAYTLSQSNTNLVNLVIDGNRDIKLDSLKTRGNGSSQVSLKVTAPNGKEATKIFNVTVNPMTDIEGRVDSLFSENNNPLSGVTVKYKGKTATTNENGYYHIKVTPSTTKDTLVFNKDGFYERRPSPFAPTNDLVKNDNMADTSLHMDFFNGVARSRSPAGTHRWVTQPVWYINTTPPLGGGTITQEMIDTAVSIITHDIPKFTNNYIQNPQIIIGTNPPPPNARDTIEVMWDNTIPGLGEHGEAVDGQNKIYSAYAKFRTGAGRGQMGQELLQNFGPRMDSNLQYPSIFNSPVNGNFIENIDLKVGKFLYSRNPGNFSPDTDK